MKRFTLSVAAVVAVVAVVAGCSSVSSAVPFVDLDSAAVKAVKNGSVQACPASTVGEMADAFFGDPQWSDFTATTGGQVVELRGEMSVSNSPATALVQFTVDGTYGFEVEYLELNGVPQSRLVLAILVKKMCAAV